MKRSLSTLAVISTLAISGSALADGWKTLPFLDAGWKPNFTLAATVGSMDIKDVGAATSQGLELSLDCPWFQPPQGALRQQFNYSTYKKDNISLNIWEMNPHYYITVAEGWTVGFGPGVGYVQGTVGSYEAKLPSIQFSADVNYRKGHYFAGVGARVQNARNDQIGTLTGLDNSLLNVKLGYNF
ncbi:MAG: hypothetical protein WCI39_00600 [Gallionellaceae bacterium]